MTEPDTTTVLTEAEHELVRAAWSDWASPEEWEAGRSANGLTRVLAAVDRILGARLATQPPQDDPQPDERAACHRAEFADHCPACPGPVAPDQPPVPVDRYCPWHGDLPTAYDTCSCTRRAAVTQP